MKSSNTKVHKPIKVLIVVDSLAGGGAQELIYQLCSHLSRERIQFSVCALRSGGVYQEKIQALGVPVYVLSPTRNLIYLPLIMIKLFRLLRSQQYDVVHTFLEGSFVIGTPLAHMAKIPSIHSIMARKAQLPGWYFPLMAWWQQWVSAYLVGVDLEELIKAGVQENKIKLVEASIDLTEMLSVDHSAEQIISPFDLIDAYPVVLSAGRLHPDKGHEYAIRVWPYVLKDWPLARLLIVGEGKDGRRLRTLVEEFTLTESVLFTGYRGDLATLFKRADMFLRTSINEGVNMVTIQAMAASLPVIGFKVECRKDFVIHGISGWLVGLRDESALSQAIIKMSADRRLMGKLGQRARIGVKNYYDMTRMVTFYETLYGAVNKRQLNTLSDMREVMWPIYNPFLFGQTTDRSL
jgi:glycosyltransferase involved in cell wall biosynthesis